MPQPPGLRSPFAEGFAALWWDPALLAAELSWRWCFGFAAWLLAILSAGLFLDSLTVSPTDELLLRSLQPILLDRALHDIFRGSLLRLVWVQALLFVGLAFLWAFAATAGRAATLHRVTTMFGEDDDATPMTWHFEPVFALNLMRAAWSATALGAAIGSFALGVAFIHQERAARAAFFFVFGIALACVFGFLLNWFLGVAPLFCIREGLSANDAIGRTIDFCAERGASILGVSLGFLVLRVIWGGTMFLFFLWPLRLLGEIAPGWLILMMLIVALVYFAGADLLYLARLGAYAALAARSDENTLAPAAEAEPNSPAFGPGLPGLPPNPEPV